jgi:hypothetical protein
MHNYVHGICCIFTAAFKLLNNYKLRELTPWNRALLEKTAVPVLVKIFPTLDGNQWFTKSHHHYTDPDEASSCPPKSVL